MESIKGHIKGLSGKHYQALYSLNSLDFLLLFIPIKPAFIRAVAPDRDLGCLESQCALGESLDVAVRRAHGGASAAPQGPVINAQEIAKRGAELYDKCVSFVEDMNSLRNRLKQAPSHYDEAYGKLSSAELSPKTVDFFFMVLGTFSRKPYYVVPGKMANTDSSRTSAQT